MKKIAGLVCVVLMGLMVALPSANAYDCWTAGSFRTHYQDADVVVIGRVLSKESMGASDEELGTERTEVTIAAYEIWKGLGADNVNVRMDTEAFYEYDFQVGKYYVFLGYRIYDDRISIIGCPRIHSLDPHIYRALNRIDLPTVRIQDIPLEAFGIKAPKKVQPLNDYDEEAVRERYESSETPPAKLPAKTAPAEPMMEKQPALEIPTMEKMPDFPTMEEPKELPKLPVAPTNDAPKREVIDFEPPKLPKVEPAPEIPELPLEEIPALPRLAPAPEMPDLPDDIPDLPAMEINDGLDDIPEMPKQDIGIDIPDLPQEPEKLEDKIPGLPSLPPLE